MEKGEHVEEQVSGIANCYAWVFSNVPGIVLIKYDKTCRQGNDCHKGRRWHFQISRNGGSTHHAGLHREIPVLFRRQREKREEYGLKLYWDFQGRFG